MTWPLQSHTGLSGVSTICCEAPWTLLRSTIAPQHLPVWLISADFQRVIKCVIYDNTIWSRYIEVENIAINYIENVKIPLRWHRPAIIRDFAIQKFWMTITVGEKNVILRLFTVISVKQGNTGSLYKICSKKTDIKTISVIGQFSPIWIAGITLPPTFVNISGTERDNNKRFSTT